MSASVGTAPIPPPLPIARSAQPPPTLVEFLLSQVRSTLRYLSEIGGFDPIEELGKRNAWLRKTLTETSILPTTVETALSLTTGPLLSDGQKQAIVQLVEYSQKGVANKLTDPGLQKRTLTGAKTAQSSTSRAMLQSDAAGDSRVVASSGQLGSNSVEQSLASLQMQSEGDTSSSSEDDDERGTTITNHGPINANNWQTGVSSIADTATLTVLSDPITDASANSSVGGTNTTFVVEPGLAISCSLVVVKGGQDLEQRLELAREKSSFSAISQQPDLHGASTVPPPPPSHPEVLAIRRQSGTGAPTLTGVAQPPIPPRPTTYRPS
ncbi:hypothetical protein [Sporisorium scitamineum]|uniref:Uncharacterized protein n=1 Tax=Sporisorium scitamineum TaxID=49012 RepID=A0A0F7RVD8_9BASI|nr:hypothetical protein [Sporisorium scitamineum]